MGAKSTTTSNHPSTPGCFKATTAYTSACTDAGATGNSPEGYDHIRGGCSFPWMIAVV